MPDTPLPIAALIASLEGLQKRTRSDDLRARLLTPPVSYRAHRRRK